MLNRFLKFLLCVCVNVHNEILTVLPHFSVRVKGLNLTMTSSVTI